MECERFNALLSAYADGMLSRRKAAAMERHLCQCRRCRDDLAEIRVLRRLLRALPDPGSTDVFWSAARRGLQHDRPQRRRALLGLCWPRHGWALAAAVGAVLVLALVPRPLEPGAVHADPLTVNPDALVALHASIAAGRPAADSAALHFSSTESRAADWSDDHQLDAD